MPDSKTGTRNISHIVAHLQQLKPLLDLAVIHGTNLEERMEREGECKRSWPEVDAFENSMVDFFGSIPGPALKAASLATLRL